MAFSPTESPLYGGDELTITVDNPDLPDEASFFILYTGSSERHASRAQRINRVTLQSNIPDHSMVEDVNLSLYHSCGDTYLKVAQGQFKYSYDSAHHLARFLLDCSLDISNLPPHFSEEFDLSKEDLATLDSRLRKVLEHMKMPDGWNLPGEKGSQEEKSKENLFHFAAQHGLIQVVTFLLEKPGFQEALYLTDSQGYLPGDVALEHGHKDLAELLLRGNPQAMVKSKSMKFETNGAIVNQNRNGSISITTANVMEETAGEDIDLLKTIEAEMAGKRKGKRGRHSQNQTENASDRQGAAEGKNEAPASNTVEVLTSSKEKKSQINTEEVKKESLVESSEKLKENAVNTGAKDDILKIEKTETEESDTGVPLRSDGSSNDNKGCCEEIGNVKDEDDAEGVDDESEKNTLGKKLQDDINNLREKIDSSSDVLDKVLGKHATIMEESCSEIVEENHDSEENLLEAGVYTESDGCQQVITEIRGQMLENVNEDTVKKKAVEELESKDDLMFEDESKSEGKDADLQISEVAAGAGMIQGIVEVSNESTANLIAENLQSGEKDENKDGVLINNNNDDDVEPICFDKVIAQKCMEKDEITSGSMEEEEDTDLILKDSSKSDNDAEEQVQSCEGEGSSNHNEDNYSDKIIGNNKEMFENKLENIQEHSYEKCKELLETTVLKLSMACSLEDSADDKNFKDTEMVKVEQDSKGENLQGVTSGQDSTELDLQVPQVEESKDAEKEADTIEEEKEKSVNEDNRTEVCEELESCMEEYFVKAAESAIDRAECIGGSEKVSSNPDDHLKNREPQNGAHIVEPDISFPDLSDSHGFGVLEEKKNYSAMKGMILGASIDTVRNISRDIQNLRKYGLKDSQRFKNDGLQKYSSCPALDIQGRNLSSYCLTHAEHHKSMLDLAPGVGLPSYVDSESTLCSDHLASAATAYDSDSVESSVRICVNGVTVDSSEDYPADMKQEQEGESPENTELPFVAEQGRWRPDPFHPNTRQKTIHIKNISSLGSKSYSLSSLNGTEESDEDLYHDARENQTPSQSMMNLSMTSDMLHIGTRTRMSGVVDFDRNVIGTKGDQSSFRPISSWTSKGSNFGVPLPAKSTTDLPREVFSIPKHQNILNLERKSPSQSSDSPDEGPIVSFSPYSPITKSLSTPSIPAATAEALKGPAPGWRRHHKLRNGSSHCIQKLFEEYDPLRRQAEIEEEEEIVPVTKRAIDREEPEVSLLDFLNETPFEGKQQCERKEEKKRRPGVLAKLGSTRKKPKKVKDGKENKHKSTTHQFVSISISNSSLCNVCGRSMANKSSVQCENCLIMVHENSCKDQVNPCAKQQKQPKVLHDGGSGQSQVSTQAFREKQFTSLPAPVIAKALDPMKRSASVPVRPQIQHSTNFANQRYSLPNRVITEENEHDLVVSGQQDSGYTDINETISESLESLEESGVDASLIEDDPLLRIDVDEPEAWSITVEKKILKKLNSKEIKRQDTIWELIQKEKGYCRTLRIMQKLFFNGMLNEVGFPHDEVEKIFPCLDDLLDIHLTFLSNLQELQSRHKDRIVDEIGKTLIEQFNGNNASQIKDTYGYFCSHHKEAVEVYKDFKKTERKFHNFIKRCANKKLCEKREVPDFILLVTIRLTKYPTLIEAILKNTKDKKERENLSKALTYCKEILQNVDAQVKKHQMKLRLIDIYNRLDIRSTTTFRGMKFKKSTLLSNDRELRYEGMISWKNARGKVTEVIAIILTDILILLQENNQKYTFCVQDNKSSVIPLFKLLVREKGDTKETKGIYLISQSRRAPEMYELVCKTTQERQGWIKLLRSAVEECPVEDLALSSEIEVEKQDSQWIKVHEITESMVKKDNEIVNCCAEKKRLLNDLAELYSCGQEDSSSVGKAQGRDNLDQQFLLKSAIEEIRRLTAVFMEHSNLSTSAFGESSGEQLVISTNSHSVPKRAETFAGFDNIVDSHREGLLKRHFPAHPDGRSSSMFNLRESEGFPHLPASCLKEQPKRMSSAFLQNVLPKPHADHIDVDGKSSERDSYGELSPRAPPGDLTKEQQLSVQQNTANKNLQAQLAEANEKINKLSLGLHERSDVYKHNQLEELRNLKEDITRQRQELQEEKLRTKSEFDKQQEEIEKQWVDLKIHKEELQRQREVFQRQLDLLREHGKFPADHIIHNYKTERALDRILPTEMTNSDRNEEKQQIYHRRSASASVGMPYEEAMAGCKGLKNFSGSKNADPKQHSSLNSLQNVKGNKLPLHLLSATNKQKVGDIKVQQLPLKLSSSSASTSGIQGGPVRSSGPMSVQAGVSKHSHGQTIQNWPAATAGSHSSGMSQLMKLAEPNQRGRLHSHPSQNYTQKEDPKDGDVIYF